MADLILADRSDGRIIAGLVTSLVFHWHRLPIGLQAAILSHATETGFGPSGAQAQPDRRIVSFITHHQRTLRDGAPARAWTSPGRWISSVYCRLLGEHLPVSGDPETRRRTILSETARGLDRARRSLARLRALRSTASSDGR